MTGFEPHDVYLADLPADQRAALLALRARIVACLPTATPCMSYAMPAFRVAAPKGTKVVAGFAAFKHHLGFYPFSGNVVPAFAARLADEGFKTSKSGVLFTPEHPLPDWALDAMIAARLAEIG
ncbi:MAG: DUF1801 domain-containing protein [Maritimibacter sp.]|nr:DUF1801 domain-containing protein [Maritimibacter sp.]